MALGFSNGDGSHVRAGQSSDLRAERLRSPKAMGPTLWNPLPLRAKKASRHLLKQAQEILVKQP